jgi:uncharacterized protein YhaN
MKLLELYLSAFGPFTDFTIDLSGDKEGLHIIYGPNEAGKSSALRAITALFYGILARSSDNFLHEHKNLRVGSRIIHSDGSELTFTRRKGLKNTLIDPSGSSLPDISLQKYIGNMGEDIFSSMFGINHMILVEGGEDILKGGGNVGESLFAASMGGTHLHEILQSLEEDASALFRSRGSTQLINKAINDYKEAKKESSKSSLSGREWAEHDSNLKNAEKHKEKLGEELGRLTNEKTRLERLQKAIPKIGAIKESKAELSAIGEIRILPYDFSGNRRKAYEKLTRAKETLNREEERLKPINGKIASLSVPEALLQQEENISAIHEKLGSHRKALTDMPGLEQEKDILSEESKAIIEDIYPDHSIKDIKELSLSAAKRVRVQELGNKYQALIDNQKRWSKDVRSLDEKLTTINKTLNNLVTPRNAGKLRRAVTSAQKHGDLGSELKKAVSNLLNDKTQSEINLKKLGLWTGTLEELESLPIPSDDTVDRIDESFNDLESQSNRIKDRLTTEEERKIEIESKLREIRLSGIVPSEDDLNETRRQREEGWILIKRAWLDSEDVKNEAESYNPENSLNIAYEKKVIEADELADRLRREADRVAQQAELLSQREKYSGEIASLKDELNKVGNESSSLRKEWSDLWQDSGITPISPKEMRSWITKQNRLVQQIEKLRTDQNDINTLKSLIHDQSIALNEYLENLGEKSTGPEQTLVSLIDRCLTVIDLIEEDNRSRKELEKEAGQLQDSLSDAIKNKEDAVEEFSIWQSDWLDAIQGLRLSKETTPTVANTVLVKVEELFKKRDQIKLLGKRIDGMKSEGEKFTTDVKFLVDSIAPYLRELPADQAVAGLNSRLKKALEDSATLKQLEHQRSEKEESITDARTTIESSESYLNELCKEAGCSEYEELEKLEKLSEQACSIQEKINNIEDQLLDLSGGSTVDDLIKEAEEIDPDALPSQIKVLTEKIEELEERRSETQEAIGREKNELERMDGSAKAAEAAENAQEFLASVHNGVDRYMRLRLASVILRNEIERYRSQNQAPILDRASKLFSQLTLGSFTDLRTDFNEKDEPILIGVRPSGERVNVEGMSDGSRDQLYLSLRLASLEKYLKTNEPVPLIVDDILINFDDERAKATLKVLADLSHKNQIIFFTHHQHLVELAKKTVDGGVLQLHFIDIN